MTPATFARALAKARTTTFRERFLWLLAALRGSSTLAAELVGMETLRPEHATRVRSLMRAQHAIDRSFCQLRAEIEAVREGRAVDAPDGDEMRLTRGAA